MAMTADQLNAYFGYGMPPCGGGDGSFAGIFTDGQPIGGKNPLVKTEGTIKTPVSLLTEFASRVRDTIQWTELKPDPPTDPRKPAFKYEVKLSSPESGVGTGSGSSKQEARHQAAGDLLIQLAAKGRYSVFQGFAGNASEEFLAQYIRSLMPERKSKKESHNKATEGGGEAPKPADLNSDPVSLLNTEVTKRYLFKPEYSDENAGVKHGPFSVKVTLGHLWFTGTHETKKGAKQAAAQQMLDSLRQGPLDDALVDRERMPKPRENKDGAQERARPKRLPPLPEKAALAEALAKQAKVKHETEWDKFVTLAQDLGLPFGLLRVVERGPKGDYRCLLKFETRERLVFYAAGKSELAAKQNAAASALSYLALASGEFTLVEG